jgi:hypothetical protein
MAEDTVHMNHFAAEWLGMASFSGDTDVANAHERMEDLVGYGIWLDDFVPISIPD